MVQRFRVPIVVVIQIVHHFLYQFPVLIQQLVFIIHQVVKLFRYTTLKNTKNDHGRRWAHLKKRVYLSAMHQCSELTFVRGHPLPRNKSNGRIIALMTLLLIDLIFYVHFGKERRLLNM